MNLRRQAVCCALWTMIALSACSCAFAQSTGDQQAAPPRSDKNSQGFLGYALGKVNPQQTDYGAQVAADRASVVSETLDNLLFWSNAVTLLLFSGIATLYIFNLRSGEKKEVIASILITELWNGRVCDRAEIEKRTGQYNLLVEKHNSTLALSAGRTGDSSASEGRAEFRTQRKVERLIEGPRAAGKTEAQAPATSGSKKSAPAPQRASVSDIEQQNLLLERRIEAMRNTEQNLKERLNQTTALLDQERQRNRTLKGA